MMMTDSKFAAFVVFIVFSSISLAWLACAVCSMLRERRVRNQAAKTVWVQHVIRAKEREALHTLNGGK
jgi:hypothetical protein